ncbi:hypothetical protein C8N40_1146 [Pontibacter mucosus]|uniref:Uncharacterized protein n=1 Tax=Pontibacter mucosus TaxID=1649266 RepID=A0A2T5Y7D2_9BACT|nr:hypothetical protein [Pontibacter mucosus]PTX12208.1 hypothetical protein C8N40_1146 [Pontibacter mucosus]
MPKTGEIAEESINRWRLPLLSALLGLVVIALLGLLLRGMLVAPVVGLNYKYLLHAHSHAALLGWLYPVLFIALLHAYLPPEVRNKQVYFRQFWLSQGAVLGMLLSFPVQGYAAVSITFSTAHILLSYWFILRFWIDAKAQSINGGMHQLSFLFIKAALFFLALSSLGPWAMGPIMASGHSGTALYYNAIYFYLHFLYNGWFTFAVLGLLFWLLEKYNIGFSQKYGLLFFRLMFWACLPAYLLSVLWVKPGAVVYFVGGLAALVQLLALGVLLGLLWPLRARIYTLFSGWGRALFILAGTAFILKILMQLSTAFPYMADLAYNLRFFIIGYLHLVLIGFVSLFMIAWLAQQGWVSFSRSIGRWGMGLFILAFIGTEVLLFGQGLYLWLALGAIPKYNELLFGVSVLLPLGALLFFGSQLKYKPPHTLQPSKHPGSYASAAKN